MCAEKQAVLWNSSQKGEKKLQSKSSGFSIRNPESAAVATLTASKRKGRGRQEKAKTNLGPEKTCKQLSTQHFNFYFKRKPFLCPARHDETNRKNKTKASNCQKLFVIHQKIFRYN
ncbi:hypothetical protein IC582_025373 [Cucumis melo]